MKNYLLYYDFQNTTGNHTGMAYLVNFLSKKSKNNIIVKHLSRDNRLMKYISICHSLFLVFYLIVRLNKNDKIIFVEYLTKGVGNQDSIAKLLRILGLKNIFIGIVHLSGEHLLELYGSKETVLTKLKYLDKVVVLGSSLGSFISEIGYSGKVIHTFHYVDLDYYKPFFAEVDGKKGLHVVFIGNLKRNFSQLAEIITLSSQDIHFHICKGKSNVEIGVEQFSNVTTYGYLEEEKLLSLMQGCDINLSVMEDTVGSNVITTALAVGLVQVVSDVGSIRDYCTTEESFFCKSTADFVRSIAELKNNPIKLSEMKRNSTVRAKNFSLDKFWNEFSNITENN